MSIFTLRRLFMCMDNRASVNILSFLTFMYIYLSINLT